MAEMGYGYGSEYQLLRILGHHQNWINDKIKNILDISEDIFWFDYPVDSNRLSLDGEYKGIQFLKKHPNYNEICKKWKEFWPQTGNAQNWDGICQIGNTYILIEAKARLGEIESNTGASEQSLNLIQNSFNKTKEHYDIKSDKDWGKKYYQMANRLAFVYFLKSCGIEAKLLDIYFINGYIDKSKKSNNKNIVDSNNVNNIKDWESVIEQEYLYLGLNNLSKSDVKSLFINCLKLD